MHPIILAELARIRQQDLLKEAEYWRELSQAMGNKSDRLGLIQRMMTDVFKCRIEFPLVTKTQFQALRKIIVMKLIITK